MLRSIQYVITLIWILFWEENGDFCYVVLYRFYLSERLPLADYQPTEDRSGFKKKLYFRGYSLVFSFVRDDGVASNFKQIFMME